MKCIFQDKPFTIEFLEKAPRSLVVSQESAGETKAYILAYRYIFVYECEDQLVLRVFSNSTTNEHFVFSGIAVSAEFPASRTRDIAKIRVKKIKFGEELDSGTQAQIYECLDFPDTVAKHFTFGEGKSIRRYYDEIFAEISAYQQCDHPNIPKYVYSFCENIDSCSFVVVMQRIYGVCAQEFKYKHEIELWCVLKQLIGAAKYLETKDICHRDIHSRNAIIVGGKHENKAIRVYIIDFCHSKRISENRPIPGFYIPPQIQQKYVQYAPETQNPGEYAIIGNMQDMYSIGALMVVIVAGFPVKLQTNNHDVNNADQRPYRKTTHYVDAEKARKQMVNNGVSRLLAEYICQMIAPDAKKRIEGMS